jgi:ribonuclease P protein component
MKKDPSDANSQRVNSGEGTSGEDGGPADATLPRSQILRGGQAFSSLFRRSSLLRGRHLHLRYRILDPDAERKVAFITPKRIGGAVVRNRVRRRMRECYRTNKDKLFPALHQYVCSRSMPDTITDDQGATPEKGARALPGIHVAFLAQTDRADYGELEQDMRALMRQFVKKAGDRISG